MTLPPILSSLRRSKTGAVLVTAQVALTLAITTNAISVVRTRLQTTSRPSGLDEPGVFQIMFVGIGAIEDRRAMIQRDLETIRAVPGVIAAATTSSMPLSTSGSGLGMSATGDPESEVVASVYFGGDGFVEATGLTIVEGRDFEAAEIGDVEDGRMAMRAGGTVILSRALADRLFPEGGEIVGRTAHLGTGARALPLRVVGIVQALMSSQAEPTPRAQLSFVLPATWVGDDPRYVVRAAPQELSRVMKDVETALTGLRRDRVCLGTQSMEEMRARRYRHETTGARMLTAVSAMLLLVTGSGIVGICSLWVGQRRKQIGVRRALGARRRDIVRELLAENVMLTSSGIVAGAALAVALNGALAKSLQVAPLPAGLLAAGAAAASALGLLAALGPAWRAASIPPAVATRSA